jgi:hypothetical protein
MKIILSLASAFVLMGTILTVPVGARSSESTDITMQTMGFCVDSYTDNFTRTTLSPDWVKVIGKNTLVNGQFKHLHDSTTFVSGTTQFNPVDTDLESQIVIGDFEATVDIKLESLVSLDTEVKLDGLLGIWFMAPTTEIEGSYIGFTRDINGTSVTAQVYKVVDNFFEQTSEKVLTGDASQTVTFKITRVGSTVTHYVKENGTFVALGTGHTNLSDNLVITLSSYLELVTNTAANRTGTTAEVIFDNLSLTCGTTEPEPTEEEKVVYRFFNKKTGSWLYTDSVEEKNAIMMLTTEWSYEGEKFKIIPLNAEDTTGTIPVYRFFNKCIGGHVFTISETEKQSIQGLSCYLYEGEKFRVYDKSSVEGINMYRYFDKVKGYHLFTASESEKSAVDGIVKFSSEGVAFKVISL